MPDHWEEGKNRQSVKKGCLPVSEGGNSEVVCAKEPAFPGEERALRKRLPQATINELAWHVNQHALHQRLSSAV